MTIEDVRKYHFDPKEVIKGLNGYYESDKCNSYITVRRNDIEGPAYLSTNLWLSALIEWLREDYDIFYRPGLTLDQVEAAKNAAKMCGLRAHIKDELGMRDLWFDKNADIPELVDTLFKSYDECSKARERNRENATKLSEVTRELKKELNALKDTVSLVRSRLNSKFIPLPGYEDDLVKLADIALGAVEARDETINRLTRPWNDECKDIMNYIRQEASRNGFDLPEEIDGGPLTIKRVFHDLLELLGKKEAQRKAVNEQLDKAAADYQALDKEYQEFKNSQKSDINKLIRDYCTTHGIIAPSRYFSDRVSVEYVFSLLDSYSEQRNKAYDDRDRAVDDYKLSLKDYILHDIKKRGYRYDGLETKSIEDIVDWIITMATHAYKEVEDVQKETKRKCYWYLWDALKKLSPECDALKIDHYEDLVDRIFFEMCFVTENCKQCQRKHSTEKLSYIRRTNKAEEEVKKLNDVIKKLKELLNEINKEEDGEWFKP